MKIIKTLLVGLFLASSVVSNAWPPSYFKLPKSDHEKFLEEKLGYSIDVEVMLGEGFQELCNKYGIPESVWHEIPYVVGHIIAEAMQNDMDDLDEYLKNFNECDGEL